ncbi:MAG: hypothetical protein HC822_23210 [Oscillochloris sp.]|nr:hypothetical protein [Oscillochloris sp.]
MSAYERHRNSSPLHARWRGYRLAAWIGQAILLGAIIVVLMRERFDGALVLGGFLLAAFGFMVFEDRLPNLFDLLFVVAALVNAAGWVWDLYAMPGYYDEIAHAYTTFAITLALGWLAYGSLFGSFREHRWLFMLVIASFGIALGAIWEIGEWTVDVLFPVQVTNNMYDTMIDLIVDSIGALFAGVVSVWALSTRKRR